ncbi:MAG: hypothetical protein OXC29_00505, partial [Rhodococcus sp.]|nr:hypothetical protein [Rhodococcus sp. (in: high G+C Gram-positive bacteria)]
MTVTPIDDYRLNATAELQAEWPPQPVWERIQWLDELRAAYDGYSSARAAQSLTARLMAAETAHGTPTVRWCQWAAKEHAAYLTSSTPKLRDINVTAELFSAAVDMCRYGAALLWPDGDTFKVLDPRWWVPSETGGWYYILPQVSDKSRVVDHCLLWHMNDGTLSITAHPFSGATGSGSESQGVGGSINTDTALEFVGSDGELTKAETATVADLLVVPNLPLRGAWGTPLIEAGVPWQDFAAKRWKGIDKLSVDIEDPLLTYRVADGDVHQVTGEDYDPSDPDFDFLDEDQSSSDVL